MPIYFGENRGTPVRIIATTDSGGKPANANEMTKPAPVSKIGVGSNTPVVCDKLPTGSGVTGKKVIRGFGSGRGGRAYEAPYTPGALLGYDSYRDDRHGDNVR